MNGFCPRERKRSREIFRSPETNEILHRRSPHKSTKKYIQIMLISSLSFFLSQFETNSPLFFIGLGMEPSFHSDIDSVRAAHSVVFGQVYAYRHFFKKNSIPARVPLLIDSVRGRMNRSFRIRLKAADRKHSLRSTLGFVLFLIVLCEYMLLSLIVTNRNASWTHESLVLTSMGFEVDGVTGPFLWIEEQSLSGKSSARPTRGGIVFLL